jgi:hypothetical protein
MSTASFSTVHKKEAVSPTRAAPTTLKKGLWMTLAPASLYRNDPPSLLADVRGLLHARPQIVHYPERLAVLLGVDEYAVRDVLEALEIENEVLA